MELYSALKKRNATVQVLYPRSPHIPIEPKQLRDWHRRVLEGIGKYEPTKYEPTKN